MNPRGLVQTWDAPGPKGLRRHAEQGGGWRWGVGLLTVAVHCWPVAPADLAGDYTVERWDREHGLLSSTVSTVLQTRDGYLWVGTHAGLGRFNGETFRWFTPENTPALKASDVRSLCEARGGTLWLGTAGGGVAALRNGRWASWTTAQGLAHNEVFAIVEGPDGAVWFGTGSGAVSCWKDGRWTNYGVEHGLPTGLILGMTVDARGRLWVGTEEGLALWTGQRFVLHRRPERPASNLVLRVWPGPEPDTLWVSYGDGDLVVYREGRFEPVADAAQWERGHVKGLWRAPGGELWLGAYSAGLYRLRAGRVERLSSPGRLEADHIMALEADREGNLWVATSAEGLKRVTPRTVQVWNSHNGLSDDGILSVCEDAAGVIWAGTYSGALNRLGPDGAVQTLADGYGLVNACFYAVWADRQGAVWVGTGGGGLFRLREGQVTRYTKRDGLGSDLVMALYEDRAGRLWAGTAGGGLSCVTAEGVRTFTTADGLAGNDIRALVEDEAGVLWIGTNGQGLMRHQEGRFVPAGVEPLNRARVWSLHVDADHTLWVGTAGHGLFRLRAGHWDQWTSRDGLPDDLIYCILEDPRGRLWLSSSKGVFSLDKAACERHLAARRGLLPVLALDETEGLPSRECTGGVQPAGWRARDGRLWFPTVRGLAVLDPEQLARPRSAPPVVLESVVVDGQTRTPASAARYGPGVKELGFRYAAVSPGAAAKARFRHRLVGRDTDWVEAGRSHQVQYTNLAAGRYVWQVQASLDPAHWSEPPLEFAFVLTPFFWQQWWFRLLAAGGGLGVVGWTIRVLSVRRLQRQLLALERARAVEQERLRIARDMHDELGGSLTRIAWLSDLARRSPGTVDGTRESLERISTTARSTLRALQEIVWAVHPDHDTLENLSSYLCQHAEQVFRGTPIRCRFDTPTLLPERALAAEVRHNLIMIVKEALNNVLKHSGATEVRLRIEVRGAEGEIHIEDNGRGLPPSAPAGGGRGLQNMRRRAADLRGTLHLSSTPGRGTCVQVRWPLPPHEAADTPPAAGGCASPPGSRTGAATASSAEERPPAPAGSGESASTSPEARP